MNLTFSLFSILNKLLFLKRSPVQFIKNKALDIRNKKKIYRKTG